jgi:hypothetical protein
MSSSLSSYCNCMQEIRDRLALVDAMGQHTISTSVQVFDIELAFLQIRKCLELIAFASLIANKDKYSAAYTNFAAHWKAKGMLECIEKLNPNFYPLAVEEPKVLANGVKHLDFIPDGFLTRSEFVTLYEKSSEILHSRNPFSSKDPVVKLGYSTKEWVSRIKFLLKLHLTHLVDGSVWIIQIPNEGQVRGYSAEPRS